MYIVHTKFINRESFLSNLSGFPTLKSNCYFVQYPRYTGVQLISIFPIISNISFARASY